MAIHRIEPIIIEREPTAEQLDAIDRQFQLYGVACVETRGGRDAFDERGRAKWLVKYLGESGRRCTERLESGLTVDVLWA